MHKSFDLTSREGAKKAIDQIKKMAGPNPLLWVIGKIVDSTAPAIAVSKQADAAAEIIRAGKENGVDKMTIVMDEQAGAHFKAPIEGVDIAASIGSKGKVTIDVTYK